MKEFRGTKCKWHAIEYAGRYSVQSGAYYGDMDILDYENFSKEEVDANAKLIAASPDLLEVCLWIVNDFEGDYMLDGEIVDKPDEAIIDRYYEAKKAIKKALGE